MKHILKTLKGYYIKLKYAKKLKKTDKVILIRPTESKFNRYLYSFIYMIVNSGYKPVLNVKNRELTYMNYDNYQKLIFKTGLFYKPKKGMQILKEIIIDTDYYTSLFDDLKKDAVIPMSMHPFIYARNIKPIEYNDVNRVIFFAGSVNAIGYNKKQIVEGVITRHELIKLIKSFKNSIHVKNKKDIEELYRTDSKAHFVIYIKDVLSLNPNELFEQLSRSSFFLAAPGIGMPLSHNLIEAMCCHCIPVIQDIYAQMFRVPLEHKKNCLIYKDKNDLKNISSLINKLSNEIIEKMKKNVEIYYDQHLSPEAVTSFILQSKHKHFYLQAEGRSIILYKNRKQKFQTN